MSEPGYFGSFEPPLIFEEMIREDLYPSFPTDKTPTSMARKKAEAITNKLWGELTGDRGSDSA